jgi:hypothetical protein
VNTSDPQPVKGRSRLVIPAAVGLAVLAGGLLAIRAVSQDAPVAAVMPSTPQHLATHPPVSCTSGWQVAEQPEHPYADRLVAVSGAAWDDLWAVGTRFHDQGGTDSEALVEHWDGERWAFDPGADVGPRSELHAVAALASDDVWAVGLHGRGPLVEHWDGTRWEVVPVQFGPRRSGVTLDAIAAVSPDDIWVLGHYGAVREGHSISRDLFLHWEGRSWTVVESPVPVDPLEGTSAIQGIAATRGGDVWGVGGRVQGFSKVGVLDGPLVERWDGRKWKVAEEPAEEVTLGMVSARAGDVWAARGDHLTTSGTYGIGGIEQILHWDGAAWTVARRIKDGTLSGLAARGKTEVWAAGSTNEGRPLLLRWGGRRWKTVLGTQADAPAAVSSGFSAVTVAGDGALVAFGSDYPFDLGGEDRDPTDPPTNQLWVDCP